MDSVAVGDAARPEPTRLRPPPHCCASPPVCYPPVMGELIITIGIGAFYCISFLATWAAVEAAYLVVERLRRK